MRFRVSYFPRHLAHHLHQSPTKSSRIRFRRVHLVVRVKRRNILRKKRWLVPNRLRVPSAFLLHDGAHQRWVKIEPAGDLLRHQDQRLLLSGCAHFRFLVECTFLRYPCSAGTTTNSRDPSAAPTLCAAAAPSPATPALPLASPSALSVSPRFPSVFLDKKKLRSEYLRSASLPNFATHPRS